MNAPIAPQNPPPDDSGIPGVDPAVVDAFAQQFARTQNVSNPFPDLHAPTPDETGDTVSPDAPPVVETGGRAGVPQVAPPAPASTTPPPPPPSPDEASPVPPSGGDAPLPPPTPPDDVGVSGVAPSDDADPTARSLEVSLPDGSTHTIDADAASRLLTLQGWAQSLTDEQRHQMHAVETGQAVAIPRADYERYVAFVEQQSRQPAVDPYAQLVDEGVDPATIERLRQDQAARDAELERLRATVNQPSPAMQAQADQSVQQRVAAYQEGVKAWATERGITDNTIIERLNQTAIDAGVIPSFVERGRVTSPTGQILADADMGEVARQAMAFALTLDPDLHSRVLAGSTPTTGSDDKVAAKRSRAASLSAAPSTAVPQPTAGGAATPASPIPGLAPNMISPDRLSAMAAAMDQAVNGS